ncbi:MAG TPA: PQQ-binding-like beta-propeller repeat protein, partial [Fimbriimonadaceae bacterium]|nr:PQQ-binding-like beta-propeller repeat protein [Fimbriimonadaceae bacterium]
MLMSRCLALALALLGASAVALAQFNGPAPLAWRWAQPTPVAPIGQPLVDGNTVIVAVGQRVHALDKDSG